MDRGPLGESDLAPQTFKTPTISTHSFLTLSFAGTATALPPSQARLKFLSFKVFQVQMRHDLGKLFVDKTAPAVCRGDNSRVVIWKVASRQCCHHPLVAHARLGDSLQEPQTLLEPVDLTLQLGFLQLIGVRLAHQLVLEQAIQVFVQLQVCHSLFEQVHSFGVEPRLRHQLGVPKLGFPRIGLPIFADELLFERQDGLGLVGVSHVVPRPLPVIAKVVKAQELNQALGGLLFELCDLPRGFLVFVEVVRLGLDLHTLVRPYPALLMERRLAICLFPSLGNRRHRTVRVGLLGVVRCSALRRLLLRLVVVRGGVSALDRFGLTGWARWLAALAAFSVIWWRR
mmetsp:Transcript_4372/g.13893  ORF Transcript_4372/g.13893 Transcript_4372/m.13893 type:complete len:342 (+) Transcript_4372:1864-2889(+)